MSKIVKLKHEGRTLIDLTPIEATVSDVRTGVKFIDKNNELLEGTLNPGSGFEPVVDPGTQAVAADVRVGKQVYSGSEDKITGTMQDVTPRVEAETFSAMPLQHRDSETGELIVFQDYTSLTVHGSSDAGYTNGTVTPGIITIDVPENLIIPKAGFEVTDPIDGVVKVKSTTAGYVTADTQVGTDIHVGEDVPEGAIKVNDIDANIHLDIDNTDHHDQIVINIGEPATPIQSTASITTPGKIMSTDDITDGDVNINLDEGRSQLIIKFEQGIDTDNNVVFNASIDEDYELAPIFKFPTQELTYDTNGEYTIPTDKFITKVTVDVPTEYPQLTTEQIKLERNETPEGTVEWAIHADINGIALADSAYSPVPDAHAERSPTSTEFYPVDLDFGEVVKFPAGYHETEEAFRAPVADYPKLDSSDFHFIGGAPINPADMCSWRMGTQYRTGIVELGTPFYTFRNAALISATDVPSYGVTTLAPGTYVIPSQAYCDTATYYKVPDAPVPVEQITSEDVIEEIDGEYTVVKLKSQMTIAAGTELLRYKK